ncbi:hypothetical protein BJX70DRAFT_74203 [Aspergillus crustosus]
MFGQRDRHGSGWGVVSKRRHPTTPAISPKKTPKQESNRHYGDKICQQLAVTPTGTAISSLPRPKTKAARRANRTGSTAATPRLSLSLQTTNQQQTRSYSPFDSGIFIIRRACTGLYQQDSTPCVIEWATGENAYGSEPCSLILRHHSGSGQIKDVEVTSGSSRARQSTAEAKILSVSPRESSSTWELYSDSEVTIRSSLPYKYKGGLAAGERYELICTGSVIKYWELGTAEHDLGKEYKTRSEDEWIPLEADASVFFTAVGYASPQGSSSPPPLQSSDRE